MSPLGARRRSEEAQGEGVDRGGTALKKARQVPHIEKSYMVNEVSRVKLWGTELIDASASWAPRIFKI